uniref:Uncharacterized protein n=1 Tax=Cucumis melo TaxID=3656 RepID=A0A9I9CH57_CUCME
MEPKRERERTRWREPWSKENYLIGAAMTEGEPKRHVAGNDTASLRRRKRVKMYRQSTAGGVARGT